MTDPVRLAEALIGGVWGHLVGDAVGVPYEFQSASQIGDVDFGATGTHHQPPGTWSDDGALMLALLDSLLEDEPGPEDIMVHRRFDLDDQGQRALAWRHHGAYTPDGEVFDIGTATASALHAIESGVPAGEAGPAGEYDNGNGSLMRILPIALVGDTDTDQALANAAMSASGVTHGHARARIACALYVLIAARLLRGERDRTAALEQSVAALRAIVAADAEQTAALDHLLAWTEREGRGRVWDSFWSAWDAFAGASDYGEAIERAVAYGNDTDTTAAIAGGLAGIYWTIDGIPPDWLAGMRGRTVVEPLIDRLLALHGWRTSTTNPIRVNWVALAGVPGLAAAPGRLGMTFLPGKQRDGWSGMHWRSLSEDVQRLRSTYGVDTFVLLVEDHELGAARVPDIAAAMAGVDIELIRFPIRDMDVTDDPGALRLVLADVRTRIEDGQGVVVACRGGLGRTGTIVACLLRDGGLDGDAAIALTRQARRNTIERGTQVDFVHDWIGAR